MGRDEFKEGLETLGHTVELKDTEKAVVPYRITEGRFAGTQIQIGFQVPADFPVTPPGGLHIHPRLIPINTGAMDNTRAADSQPFGGEWQYLSRPYTQWPFKRTVKRYMEYVADILNTL